MVSILLDSTPAAFGIALSPLAIIAVIVMLAQGNQRGARWFLFGWAAGLFVLSLLVAAFGQALAPHEREYVAPWLAPAQIVLGAALLVWAIFALVRSRNAPTSDDLPAVLRAVDSLGPLQSFGMATFMAGVNAKNVALLLVFFVALLATTRPFVWTLASVLTFIVIASITIAAPVLYTSVRGAAAEPMLARWRRWLLSNQGVMMNGFLALVGLALIARGVAQ